MTQDAIGGVQPPPKEQVRQHWDSEPCGTRAADATDRREYFRQITEHRYSVEPGIPLFADFPSSAGKRVLEIGVGAGTDFENWCRHAQHATGVDLTDRAIALTTERLQLAGVPADRYTLQRADAEALPFPDASFDLVYSYGVLHHSPETQAAFREAMRVLKPGGTLKAMIYHSRAWTPFLLWAQHALLKGRPWKSRTEVVAAHLESPGTKIYSKAEARRMLAGAGISNPAITTRLGPGDLLEMPPGSRYRGRLYTLIFRFYPRWLVRLLGDRFGLNLLIVAKK